MKRAFFALLLAAALSLAVVGCGDSGGGGDTVTSQETGSTQAASESDDKPAKGAWGVAFGAGSADFGVILFDAAGRTLYVFDGDPGAESTCYGACARAWPPALTEGEPKARGEAVSAKVGAEKRRDGTVQLTYAGRPLYYFSGDKGGAEYNGQGARAFGGTWRVIRPDGEAVGG
ncbi:MAG TPA: hypothetical protein VFN92_07730 [Solirubrobacterales bacterium]|nr:hypothetical protein [Solirubrobacterales bacterium]